LEKATMLPQLALLPTGRVALTNWIHDLS